MDLKAIFLDKTTKSKDKTIAISEFIIDNPSELSNIIEFAKVAKDPVKATCIEAIEFATKAKPAIATEECFHFVTKCLTDKAPRIKWESAKVIGNVAQLFSNKLDKAIANLLANAEHEGTVVRWSAAFALGEILKQQTKHNKELVPAVEVICSNEEKNSIKKIYLAALKKLNKP